MTLHSDLSRLIKGQLDKNSISYDGWMPLHRLVARYFEMNVRHIHPVPRRVHFSDQTHASLGKLLRPDHDDTSGRDAWGTVFRLRQLIVDGANVNAFLSKNIRSATGWDGLLWHYGMHHFHLSSDVGVDGFVKRSDHLLFAILAPLDAYFVDVRPHPPKDDVEWVSQELLHIVHSNWPELIEANVLHGVCGTQLTDCEIHQLRRKNMNYAIEIDGKAIAPLGGGMASMDAPGDASISSNGTEHAVRCCRLSGLIKCGGSVAAGPVWKYADQVQFVCASLGALRSKSGFPDPVSLTFALTCPPSGSVAKSGYLVTCLCDLERGVEA